MSKSDSWHSDPSPRETPDAGRARSNAGESRSGEAKVIPLITPNHPKPRSEMLLSDLGDDELMQLATSVSTGTLANEAFAALLVRHQRRVRNYCAKWSGSTARSDEMAQEVFVDLWRHRGEYEPSGRFQAYLFTLVRNRCRSDHRKVTAEKKLDTYESAEADDDQLARLIDTERIHRLNDAVARLPPKLREALLLRYGAELEYGEVARIIDTNESTARSRVFMAICQLKDWAKEQAL